MNLALGQQGMVPMGLLASPPGRMSAHVPDLVSIMPCVVT
jgi:hypothetical protein